MDTRAGWHWATQSRSNGDGMWAQLSSEFPFAGKWAVDKDALFGGVRLKAKGPFTALRPLPGKSWSWLLRGTHLGLKSDSESCGCAGHSGPVTGEAPGPRGKLWTHRVAT